MRELCNSGSAPSALADRLGMTRGGISKLADRLIAKGLITRRGVAPATAGSRRLRSPGRGARWGRSSRAWRIGNDEEFFGHLDRATREAIRGAMADIVRRQGTAGRAG